MEEKAIQVKIVHCKVNIMSKMKIMQHEVKIMQYKVKIRQHRVKKSSDQSTQIIIPNS